MATPDNLPVPLAALPGWALCTATAAVALLWGLLNRRPAAPLRAAPRALLTLARLAAAVGVCGFGLPALARIVALLTAWPIWALAAGGGLALQLVVESYRFERRLVSRPVAARLLLALRLAAVLLLVAMLAQPVWTWNLTRVVERYVAVLVDDSESMQIAAARGAGPTRADVARQALAGAGAGGTEAGSVLERLGATYHLQLWRFGESCVESDPATWLAPAAGAASAATNNLFRTSTDVAGALEKVERAFPAGSLAGVLLVSDGRHNGAADPAPVARRLGVLGAPVYALAVGAPEPPRDASILSLRAPDCIYLGDQVRVTADLKFDGCRGRQLRVKLLQGETVADETTVAVADDRFQCSIRLRHAPAERGIEPYRVAIEPVEGEIRDDNNAWAFDVAVTDDRTHVLLVESYPRWEFRYLRNLFHGRDKSVQLQYVLLQPETIDQAAPPAPVAASAGRPFGESQATRLPASPEEWKKFDVIVLGDLPPDVLGGPLATTLVECVAERGALLVCVAGPRHAPHAWQTPALAELLPVTMLEQRSAWFQGPEESYRVALSAAGRTHPITLLAADPAENERLWTGLPPLAWRHGGLEAKPGATVLAYAQPVAADAPAPVAGGALAAMAGALAEQRRLESRNVLLAVQSYGVGRVAFLGFDETWRLRYRVGDTFHHRFWGQLVRWGTGGPLRGGAANVRVGTERLAYAPTEPIRVSARLRDKNQSPVRAKSATVRVYRDRELVEEQPLAYVAGSHGLHEAQVGPYARPGRYRLELAGDEVVAAMEGAPEGGKAETEVLVQAVRNTAEIADLTVNRALLEKVAALSGGRVVEKLDVAALKQAFGDGTRTVAEPRNVALWDSALLLLLVVGCVCAEWLVRKRVGLV